MNTVQNIFDQMIDTRYYSEQNGEVLMCKALKNALKDDVISAEDYHIAHRAIRSYLGGFGSLAGLLDNKGYLWDFSSRLVIYQDWGNKPEFQTK